MRYNLIIIFLFFSFASCNSKSSSTSEKQYNPGDRAGADTSMIDLTKPEAAGSGWECQRWDNTEDVADAKAANEDFEMPFRSIYLFPDGKLVRNVRDQPAIGEWNGNLGKDSLILHYSGKTENYKVVSLAFNKMVLNVNGKNETYQADGFIHKNMLDDPFYPVNIQWMFKPASAEDHATLKRRMKECLHFYYLYFTDAYKRNVAYLSFYGLPSCFKFYKGAIHLTKEEELGKKWKAIFYNEKDATEAYQFYDKIISKHYDWDTTIKNWVKQDALVLKQMESKLDSL